MNSFKASIKNLFSVFYFPLKEEGKKTFFQKTVFCLKVWIKLLIIIGIYVLIVRKPLETILDYYDISYSTFIRDDISSFITEYINDFWMLILIIAFIYPFLEELMFRLPLSLNALNVSISLGAMSCFISINTIYADNTIIVISIPIIVFLISLYSFNRKILKNILIKIKKDYYVRYYYIMIILFSIFHITNYDNLDMKSILLVPFYIFPQLILGMGIANVRIKLNFWWGYFLHLLINMPFILSLIFTK